MAPKFIWAKGLLRDWMTAPFVVDVFGPYATEQIRVRRTAAPRPTNAETEAAIARTWNELEAAAERGGARLFDGQLARLTTITECKEHVTLTLGDTTYREFMGTNGRNAAVVRACGDDQLANALGVSVVPTTEDGRIVLGRRSPNMVLHGGCVHVIGGMVENADRLRDGTYDLAGSAMRELHEELGVGDTSRGRPRLLGIIRDTGMWQPELVFDSELMADQRMICDSFETATGRAEHQYLEFQPAEPEVLLSFIEVARPITPVAQGALLLFGRAAWGAGWYDAACTRLYGAIPIHLHQG